MDGDTETGARESSAFSRNLEAGPGDGGQPLPVDLADDQQVRAAATVVFLASDGAAALTGQTLCTDGGPVMR